MTGCSTARPIHLVNTDPPYNVKVEPRSNNAIAAGLSSFQGTTHHQGFDVERYPEKAKPTTRKLRAKDRPLANDFVSDEEFDRLLHAWFGNLARVLLPGRGFYIWGGYGNLGNYPPVLKACGLYFSQGIIWDKEHPVLTRKDYMGSFEIAYYGWKEGAAHQFFGPNNATDLWHIKKINPQQIEHLTQKPVELAARAMEYSSKRGENVLDLFGGSGSTADRRRADGPQSVLDGIGPAVCRRNRGPLAALHRPARRACRDRRTLPQRAAGDSGGVAMSSANRSCATRSPTPVSIAACTTHQEKSEMADKYVKKADTMLLLALACGATAEQAARQTGLTSRTVYRRLQDESFRQQIQEIRAEMVQRTAATLTAAGSESVKTLLALQQTTVPRGGALGCGPCRLGDGTEAPRSRGC